MIAVTVDAVSVRSQRRNTGRTVELERKRGQILGIAAASPSAITEHDARLAAGENRNALAALSRLFREPRVRAAERLRFVVEVVAELHDSKAILFEEARRRCERRRSRRD